MVRISRTVQPIAANVGIYEKKYARYQKYVQALRGAWE